METATIHVTEKAATKIQELLAKEGVPPETGGLRVGVQGGGCSGLTYAMRLDTQARDRDRVIEENGARLFVDPKSYLYAVVAAAVRSRRNAGLLLRGQSRRFISK